MGLADKIGSLDIVLPGEVANRLCMQVCPLCACLYKGIHAHCMSGYAFIYVHVFMHLRVFVQNKTFKSPGLSLWIKS